jgi:Zn-finger nucleic acid-binding protein
MKCPVCKDVTLLMSEKNGIEIDYCPECRGIWLDRGELEKLIERAKDEKYHGGGDSYDRKRYPQKKKKSSLFGEFFEMFGGDE